jgi:hypothetical protein
MTSLFFVSRSFFNPSITAVEATFDSPLASFAGISAATESFFSSVAASDEYALLLAIRDCVIGIDRCSEKDDPRARGVDRLCNGEERDVWRWAERKLDRDARRSEDGILDSILW